MSYSLSYLVAIWTESDSDLFTLFMVCLVITDIKSLEVNFS